MKMSKEERDLIEKMSGDLYDVYEFRNRWEKARDLIHIWDRDHEENKDD